MLIGQASIAVSFQSTAFEYTPFLASLSSINKSKSEMKYFNKVFNILSLAFRLITTV